MSATEGAELVVELDRLARNADRIYAATKMPAGELAMSPYDYRAFSVALSKAAIYITKLEEKVALAAAWERRAWDAEAVIRNALRDERKEKK